MKKNNKGFTLVELIVVLVILAILAAILVPALLGWIDKAREKSVTTNAEAAYVATQGLITEQYGSYGKPSKSSIAKAQGKATFSAAVNELADIDDSGFSVAYTLKKSYTNTASKPASKTMYKIHSFVYHSPKAKKYAKWVGGNWTVTTTEVEPDAAPTTTP